MSQLPILPHAQLIDGAASHVRLMNAVPAGPRAEDPFYTAQPSSGTAWMVECGRHFQ